MNSQQQRSRVPVLLTVALGLARARAISRSVADEELRGLARPARSCQTKRQANRAEFLDTNRRVLKAMDALRVEWQQQREAFVNAVAAEVRAVFTADVRRLVREEIFRVRENEKAGGDPQGSEG